MSLCEALQQAHDAAIAAGNDEAAAAIQAVIDAHCGPTTDAGGHGDPH